MTRFCESKFASIAIIAFCQVAAMALWFSASAVLPALAAEFQLSNFSKAALTSGVQAGFVAGCLASALLGLADRLDPRRFFAVSATIGALANALLLVVDPASLVAPALRFVTGACMAGVYPVGMKLASTWAKGDMGLMVGILVGALTLGSASPHLFNAIGGIDWRVPLVDGVGERAGRRRTDRPGRYRPQPHARAALRSPVCADCLARRAAAPREPRLSRATCGSSMRCGHGSACSSMRASR